MRIIPGHTPVAATLSSNLNTAHTNQQDEPSVINSAGEQKIQRTPEYRTRCTLLRGGQGARAAIELEDYRATDQEQQGLQTKKQERQARAKAAEKTPRELLRRPCTGRTPLSRSTPGEKSRGRPTAEDQSRLSGDGDQIEQATRENSSGERATSFDQPSN
jgi:hypothetical protein